MKPFSLLVKPASADCNLRCEYCFYLGKSELYPDRSRHRMADSVLEQMIKSYMATEQACYSIGWQGGEPTLMGVEFFRKVTSLQQKHGRSGVSVANGLQTNTTLINDEFAEHLAKYNFLVGCSMDGPPEIHDTYRRSIAGKPTHAEVMRGIEALRRNGVEFNILVLVSQANVLHAENIYRYLTDAGFLHQQYIPCVEFDNTGALQPFAITGEEWGRFMCELFDEWQKEDTHRVSIRHFDSVLIRMVEKVSNVCSMGNDCRQYFVVEHNGDIYPCDFFVEPRLKLGNIMDTSWEEVSDSALYHDFGVQKSLWNEACSSCDWLELCFGDCIKHRVYGGNPPQNLSWLCEGWKRFYAHTHRQFEAMADEVRHSREEDMRLRRRQTVMASGASANTGRNDPCPCGSGLKFKKCCGSA
ncbi:MAG: anaerobic sulfatase maturase [Kiritimatiellae bacterium]|nr:anaerobic sulfatase maturase [Kiritimatiellia bacterium]